MRACGCERLVAWFALEVVRACVVLRRAEAGCPPFFLSSWLEVHDDWKVPLR